MQILALVFLITAAPSAPAAPASPAVTCARGASLAEQDWAVPANLLLAIGLAETGQINRQTGRREPMPFSVNVRGMGIPFASADYAIDAVAALGRRGVASIDVGCFQINLQQHPGAFASLRDAFDPARNADYAAEFLRHLFTRTGSWPEAVAAYHSSDPVKGAAYRDRVWHFWRGLGGDAAPADPHVIRASVIASRIPVYTPATLPPDLRARLRVYTNP